MGWANSVFFLSFFVVLYAIYRKFYNLKKKVKASVGIEPMSSAILVQCFYQLSYNSTATWSQLSFS